ncbi:type IV pilin protein [Hydromonas duriensis]|uniref:Type IV pilus assembly protein PilE n=1 Tax=Hydromonas duriensis TaxID=1527608 RepID=A0A4R6Y8U7_9BURK|nr:type IV pilin protein [Hydromonas duriensis]TDR31859.1 type IV pilus assembly protein PilE [Hydromonas duriensis]
MKNKTNHQGFTLLELLLVIAIIAILAMISVGRYQNHVMVSNRWAAQSMLLLAQQQMEREFLRSSTYEDATVEKLSVSAQAAPSHVLSIRNGSLGQNTYILDATPKAIDALCGALSIDQSGLRQAAVFANSEQCWQ